MKRGYRRIAMCGILSLAVVLAFGTSLTRAALDPPAWPPCEDFEAYPAGHVQPMPPINCKPGWESWDAFYGVGWVVADDVEAPNHTIRFHPSPFPVGGFTYDENYATWHVQSPEVITTLYLQMDYMIQENGNMRVFLSGDNATWCEITDRLGLEKFNAPPLHQAGASLSDLIAFQGITADLYLSLTAEGPGGLNWQSMVDNICLYMNTYPYPVAIDIKPGSYPNAINLDSRGVVAVAVLTTADFDATTVDPGTVTFAGASVNQVGDLPAYQVEAKDVDGDGDTDLVLHFKAQALSLSPSDTTASLSGQTYGGLPIGGSDSVKVIAP